MNCFGLALSLLYTLSADGAVVSHVVAWGDTASPLIRQFPDSLSAPLWVRACGSRSLAFRSSRKLTWWGPFAQDPQYSPARRMPLLSIACSDEVMLGLTDTGTVVHWGPPPSLGDPTPPAGLKDVVSVAAGIYHGAALRKDGSVVAWGANLDSVVSKTNGKTGIRAISAAATQTVLLRTDSTVEVAGGKATTVDKVPVGLRGVVAISAGGRHVLAIQADGKVVAWGDTTGGRLKVPTGLDSVVAVSAGGYHSLALRKNGTVVCWGQNNKGQCDIPASVAEVVAISAGTEHSLALRRDGKVVGWGANDKGQCDVPLQSIPVQSIHMGRKAAAAILEDGRLIAWGDLPIVPIPVLPAGRRWKSVSFGTTPHAMGIDDQGKPYAWGSSALSLSTIPDSIPLASRVEASRYLSMVLTPDRKLIGWGEDNDGLVSGAALVDSVVQFDASEYRMAVLRADSSVRLWGKLVFSTDPIPDSAKGSLAVAVTDQSVLSLRASDRKVFVWNPRPGMADWHRPPAELDSVVAIAAGSVHAVALRSNGKVVCWGDTTSFRCKVPQDLPPASAVVAGDVVSMALIPLAQVQGPTSPIAARPALPTRANLRFDRDGLRLLDGPPVTVSVYTSKGARVLPARTLAVGESIGRNLSAGVYVVKAEGEPGSRLWIRTER